MAGVQDVEAAVGHHHRLAVGLGLQHQRLQVVLVDHAAGHLVLIAQRLAQFLHGDGGGADLTHRHARGHIGQGGRVGQVLAGRQGRRQGGDHRIAGTGDVEHLACPRRQMQRRVTVAQQGHAALAAGDQQRLQFQFPTQRLAPGHQIVLAVAAPRHRLEFVQVRGEQGGAAVTGKVGALGVDQHRLAGGARRGDQSLHRAQRSLAVVGEHHRIGGGQAPIEIGQQFRRVVALETVLEIAADQLLVAAHHAQLGNGGVTLKALEMALDALGFEAPPQHVAGLVLSGESEQRDAPAQHRDIERHVAGAAGPLLRLAHVDHRHRRLGRDARGVAMPVAIQHQVAQRQYVAGGEIGYA